MFFLLHGKDAFEIGARFANGRGPDQGLTVRELLSRRSLLACWLVAWLASGSVLVPPASGPRTATTAPLAGPASRLADVSTRAATLERYGSLPLYFEPNLGQTDARVQFIARAGGRTLFLAQGEAVLVVSRAAAPSALSGGDRQRATYIREAVVRMTLPGANPAAEFRASGRQAGVSAYFLGDDPAGWRPEVPHYSRVECRQVYPGIDLVYYGNQGRLEYDFVVAPGADPGQIRLAYHGADRVRLDASGNLVLETPLGNVRQLRPRVYQEVGGRRTEVAAGYNLTGNAASFQLASYNRALPLVIDPVLTYSTYLGGADSDGAFSVAVDADGAAYIAGFTRSTNFPTANGYQESKSADFDAFVTKLGPSDGGGVAPLVYSTYLGGGNPDRATSIALDSSGAAYVAGYTSSVRFPTLNAYQSERAGSNEAFLAKLAVYPGSGPVSLVYSTYLGGSESDDEAYSVAVDQSGAAYVAGVTYSSDFPVRNAYQWLLRGGIDAFVAKFGAYGGSGAVSLVYSTFLGGARADGARGIAVDATGAVYVTGYTTSTGFPLLRAYQAGLMGGTDGFLTKLNPNSGDAEVTLGFSTYIGGSGFDQPYSVALDPAGAVYVAGVTGSADYPTANAYQPVKAGAYDAFVTKFHAPSGTGPLALAYSTFFGGAGNDYAYGVAVDAAGAAYIAGTTASPDLPGAGEPQSSFGGGPADAFAAKFHPQGAGAVGLAYSAYLGGSRSDEAMDVAVDARGSIYLAGWSYSTNFPAVNAVQPEADDDDDADNDAIVAKLSVTGPQPAFASKGVVSAASYAGGAVAPGEIVAIYGTDLGPAAGTGNSGYDPSTGRLPGLLSGISVSFDGQAAPLFYVSGGQINVQVPYEVAGRDSTTVVVTRDGVNSASAAVPVASARPGVFVYSDRAIITDTLTGALIATSTPAVKGRYVTIWATGAGVTNPPVATGAPAPSTALSHAAHTEAWLNGSAVDVQFAGLTPEMVGLLQVNIRIPENAPSGANIPLRLSVGGTPAQAYIGGAVTMDLTIAIN